MTSRYSLYFDTVPRRPDRRAKQTIVLIVVVLHLLMFRLLLRDHVDAVDQLAQALIVDFHAERSAAPATTASNARDLSHRNAIVHVMSSPVTVHVADTHSEQPVANATTGAELVLRSPSSQRAGFPIFIPPRVLHRAMVAYPLDAYQSHAQGSADVLVTIAANGELIDAVIQKSSGNASLDAATLQAIRRYIFRGATKNGDSVMAQAVVSIDWHIGTDITIEPYFAKPADTRTRDVVEEKNAILLNKNAVPTGGHRDDVN